MAAARCDAYGAFRSCTAAASFWIVSRKLSFARHVEQLIHDLLERRLINVVLDYPQHLADGLVGCCHCSISLPLFNANGSGCNPALGHRCRCGDQKWLGVCARYAARAQQVESARTAESADLCWSTSPLHHWRGRGVNPALSKMHSAVARYGPVAATWRDDPRRLQFRRAKNTSRCDG